MLEPHLRSLYRGGPCLSIGGVSVGFWEGAATHDVCARLTAHEATFWAQHPGECEQIVALRARFGDDESEEATAEMAALLSAVRALLS